MKAFAKLAGAALALAAPLHALDAQGPASGLEPSDPDAILAATRSCHDAVTDERLDEDRLTAEGWSLATAERNGRPVEMPVRMFGRNSIMLIAMDSPGCVVMARLRSREDYARVIEALTAAHGSPALTEAEGKRVWVLPNDRAMQAEPTGSRERPSLRVAVIAMRGSNE
jgi:hypothetical protein